MRAGRRTTPCASASFPWWAKRSWQDLGVYPDLTAREFLDYVGILKGMDDRRSRHLRVEEMLEIVSLTSLANRKLKTFSGGMKRRIGIAQALLNDPRLLIVDEPTAGLDPQERIRFRNLLSEPGGEGRERTILLSTHIVEDIAQTCRKLAIMQQRRLIFQGTTLDLIGEARGKVWVVTTSGEKPQGNLTIVSTLRMGNTVQYRLVGALDHPEQYKTSGAAEVTPAEPSLEDSYVWLMRERRASESMLAL